MEKIKIELTNEELEIVTASLTHTVEYWKRLNSKSEVDDYYTDADQKYVDELVRIRDSFLNAN